MLSMKKLIPVNFTTKLLVITQRLYNMKGGLVDMTMHFRYQGTTTTAFLRETNPSHPDNRFFEIAKRTHFEIEVTAYDTKI